MKRLLARLFGCEIEYDKFETGWKVDQEVFELWPWHHRLWFYLNSPNDRREEIAFVVGGWTGIAVVSPDSYWEIASRTFMWGVIGWRCAECGKWTRRQRTIGSKCDACTDKVIAAMVAARGGYR